MIAQIMRDYDNNRKYFKEYDMVEVQVCKIDELIRCVRQLNEELLMQREINQKLKNELNEKN